MTQGREKRMTHADEATPQRLFPGARVRMSQLGLQRHPKYGDREGVIVGKGAPSSWRVKFDVRKTVEAIHRDYLEPVAQPAPHLAKPPAGQPEFARALHSDTQRSVKTRNIS